MASNCKHSTCQGEICRRTPTPKKPRKPIKTRSFKPKEGQSELNAWFEDKMINSIPVCENCGKSLFGLNDVDWKGSQHHVLEKSLFPSVKTHPLNHLVLGRWCCHPQWHTSMLNASKMKIFPKAKGIVLVLFEFLTPREKSKISKYYEL